MATKYEEIQAQLQVLQESYAVQLPAKFDEIDSCMNSMKADKEYIEERVSTLHRLIHGLAGSGATFGFSQLSLKARSIEKIIKRWVSQKEINSDEMKQVIIMLPQLRDLGNISSESLPDTANITQILSKPHEEAPSIYVLEEDEIQANQMSTQLERFGYQIETYTYSDELKKAITKKIPAVLVSDIGPGKGEFGVELVEQLRVSHSLECPVIFTSIRDNFELRLNAVRAGGEAFFVKPIDIDKLVDHLDRLTESETPDPYRILIVDDDVILSAHFQLILRQAGMEVSVTSRPSNIFQDIARSNPELIIMDVHMPDYSGMELAKLIRQQDTYISVPIVYLSTENDLDKQLTALGSGGDDFLNKPIEDNHLILSVAARVKRARQLSNLMSQDSLTGLLKHTHIKQQLESELSRAIRQGSSLTYVMIDIDHFKRVNDSYGHITGDRVIKSLARLLQQRLRKTDHIGRYGGEEFAIVLPDTDIQNGINIINDIRKQFSEIEFNSKGEEFTVTLSAGVSGFPMAKSIGHISQFADEALYEAKAQGRNCTILANTDS